jgi:hypothetical protein
VTPGHLAVPGVQRPRWPRLVGRALVLLAIDAPGVYIGALISPRGAGPRDPAGMKCAQSRAMDALVDSAV